MEKILEQALPEVAIEVPESIPAPVQETGGGFPWCGAGIVVLIIAAAVIGKKFIKK